MQGNSYYSDKDETQDIKYHFKLEFVEAVQLSYYKKTGSWHLGVLLNIL